MNLALRGIEADFGPERADTFRRDLRADYVLANGSMSSNQSGDSPARSAMKTPKAKPQSLPRQRDIRQKLIEADLVDCMVAIPGQLFYSTQIPVCLWFLAKDKSGPGVSPVGSKKRGQDGRATQRDRRKHTLFIDARKLGTLIDRVHRELTDADLQKIVSTYHTWRGQSSPGVSPVGSKKRGQDGRATYADIPGFCKSATTAEIAAHGREADGEPFEEKMPRLVAELHAQFAESTKLEATIRASLDSLNPKPKS